ncbi:MAG: acyl carrier protein [Planctomycetes bacterium]|nr:acyl carrier protein [Planctomycetota bacterium]
MANHRETLLGIVTELTGRDPQALEGLMQEPLADVGLDSIRQQELLAQLEDEYDVEISPEDAVHLDSLAAIERFIRGAQ